jgi:FolB domain-containing protein
MQDSGDAVCVYKLMKFLGKRAWMQKRGVVRVSLEALSVQTYLGIHESEQQAPREVIIDVHFEYDRPAADSIEASIDYRWVRDRILAAVENRRFGLIEVLGETILHAVRTEPRIRWASVRVHKIRALRQAASVTALVEWSRTQAATDLLPLP